MEFKPGEMKLNLFFKKNADVGAVADSILDKIKDTTAFNHATKHRAATLSELHVAKSEDINIFTDFKSFITVDPLTEHGEVLAGVAVAIVVAHDEFTVMSAEPLVVPV